MGIFSAILDKLRHLGHGGQAPSATPQQQQFDPARQAAPLQPTNAIQGVDVVVRAALHATASSSPRSST